MASLLSAGQPTWANRWGSDMTNSSKLWSAALLAAWPAPSGQRASGEHSLAINLSVSRASSCSLHRQVLMRAWVRRPEHSGVGWTETIQGMKPVHSPSPSLMWRMTYNSHKDLCHSGVEDVSRVCSLPLLHSVKVQSG